MTRRLSTTSCTALALLLMTVSWTTTVAAGERRVAGAHAVARVKASAPRFSPALPMRAEEFGTVQDLRSLHFDFDKAALRRADVAAIDADARWLKDNPSHEVLVEAYADERGTQPYNLALAERRAKTIRDQLVARGVKAERIVVAGYGKVRPMCTEKNEDCWAQNRRADILIRLPRQHGSGS